MAIDTHQHGRVAALDGVRGIAIAIVVIHNAGFVLQGSTAFLPKLARAITATGWISVQLFFVLSGFLITGILQEARGSDGFFRTFYIRRTLRIFPLYYAFLVAAFILVPAVAQLPGWEAAARDNQWWYWTYTANWGQPFGYAVTGLTHFWSLAVEEQFYLLWPLLVFFVSPRALIRACAAIIVLSPLLRLALRESGLPAMTAYTFTIARWDALAAGAILTALLRQESGRRFLQRYMTPIGVVAVVLWAVLVLAVRGFHEDDLYVQVVGQSIVTVACVALIHLCVAPSSAFTSTVRDAIAARWLRFLGKYSYAIYVLHYPIHLVASQYVGDWVNGPDTNARALRLMVYATGLATLSTLAAMASWRILEQPFLEMKDRFAPGYGARRS